MTDFNNVTPALATALANRGYETLTPVQESILKDAPPAADLLVS
ncbi:MAG: ATP-dependent helicase, partial [Roseibium sp.]